MAVTRLSDVIVPEEFTNYITRETAQKSELVTSGKAFYQSVLNYMRSADFNPSAEITVDELKKKLAEKPRQVSLKELNNISQY